MYCAKMCLSCADACAAEKMDMTPVHSHSASTAPTCAKRPPGWGSAGPGRTSEVLTRNARILRPRLRRLRDGVREARSRALQAVRADLPRMRRGLPRSGAASVTCNSSGNDGLSRVGSSLRALASFLRTMSRFSRDRWSMNSTPSRWSISCWRQTASRPVDLFLVALAVARRASARGSGRGARPRHIGRAPTGSPRCRARPGPKCAGSPG